MGQITDIIKQFKIDQEICVVFDCYEDLQEALSKIVERDLYSKVCMNPQACKKNIAFTFSRLSRTALRFHGGKLVGCSNEKFYVEFLPNSEFVNYKSSLLNFDDNNNDFLKILEG